MNKCKNCGIETANTSYCSNKCQVDFQNKKKIEDFLANKYVGKEIQFRSGDWTRRILAEVKGYSCNCCGISSWNGKTLVLEVNHIDGDAINNHLDNLEFLCPNCHSQTETYRARNKSSSRSKRK
jgi:hypothetical protein